ncbi:MAG: proteasome ATPase, partial [Actinobacteria bacterium]|nr:proteasome ATPase [Actinomycetota bacterium]
MAIDEGYGSQRPRGSGQRVTEGDLDELRRQLNNAQQRSERLADTLRVARDQILDLKAEVDRLAEPPSGYAVFLHGYDDATADISTGGRKMRVTDSPSVGAETLLAGQEVMLNEAMNIVKGC